MNQTFKRGRSPLLVCPSPSYRFPATVPSLLPLLIYPYHLLLPLAFYQWPQYHSFTSLSSFSCSHLFDGVNHLIYFMDIDLSNYKKELRAISYRFCLFSYFQSQLNRLKSFYKDLFWGSTVG